MTTAAMEKFDDALSQVTLEKEQFELAQRKASVYAKSSLVPKEYQDNVGNVLIAVNMANRLGADPLMVMQNLYIVHNKPGWSAQFLIGTFNSNARFSAIKYRERGEKGSDDWGFQAYCTEVATGEEISGTWVTWEMAKTEGWVSKQGSKWKSMPEQMFRYRAATFMIRSTAPEIGLGLYTKEELEDMPVAAEEQRVGVAGMKSRLNLVKDQTEPAKPDPQTEPPSADPVVKPEPKEPQPQPEAPDVPVTEPLPPTTEPTAPTAPDEDDDDEAAEREAIEAEPVTSNADIEAIEKEREESELRIFDLRKNATEIFRALEKDDKDKYVVANKWLGTKSITQLTEAKLNEFLKKFA